MAASTYLGASSHHVHCENYTLKAGEPIDLFGHGEIYEKGEWLDMKNCSGVIDSTTFSQMPNMDYISMDGCTIEECSPRAFASLEKLRSLDIRKSKFPMENEIFEDSENMTSLSLSDLNISSSTNWSHLNNLETLSFVKCTFEQLSGDMFSGLSNLKYLSISESKITEISSDCFDALLNLEGLDIRNNEIGEVDCSSMLKLANLKRLSLHHNTTSSNIDYDILKQLPALESILFETTTYKTLNFEEFPSLKTVEIGYFDEERTTEEEAIIAELESKNINFEYVFCGTIEIDMDDMQVCC